MYFASKKDNCKSLYTNCDRNSLSSASFILSCSLSKKISALQILSPIILIYSIETWNTLENYQCFITDICSAIAVTMPSLMGSKHGNANIKVMEMMNNIKENAKDYSDKDEVAAYLERIVNREAFDGKS